MNSSSATLVKELHESLKKAENELGIVIVEPDLKEIGKFCEIINEDSSIYFNESNVGEIDSSSMVMPPGYVMNLTNRVIQKIFIKIGPMFISKIRGLIHVSSEVEFFKPLQMGNKYGISIETSKPIEKVGKKGTYYSVIFKTTIKDENSELCALDDHNFFFKL